jgi:hypothetical protein
MANLLSKSLLTLRCRRSIRNNSLGSMPRSRRSARNWRPYAEALDLHLAGWPLYAIGDYFGVSKERVRQMIVVAERRLAYRVFGINPYHWEFDADRGWWTRARDWKRPRRGNENTNPEVL